MAFYIVIQKLAETSEHVEYGFGENEEQIGRILLDKKTGQTTLLENLPEYSVAIQNRAMRKIYVNWKDGKFPDHTTWAS